MMDKAEYVVTSDDADRCISLQQQYGGICYRDERAEKTDLPFTTLVRLPDVRNLPADPTDIGSYRVTARTIKPGSSTVVALFPMIRRADLTHAAADAHWRDQHAPLALVHHGAMSQYVQLAIDEVICGPEYDGFALCGFASLTDLKTRFYSYAEGPRLILDDVRQFADTRRSPRRLVAAVRS